MLGVDGSGNVFKATIPSNYWTLSGGNLYPNNTSDNVLIGTTTNTGSKKLYVNGSAYINTLGVGTTGTETPLRVHGPVSITGDNYIGFNVYYSGGLGNWAYTETGDGAFITSDSTYLNI